MRTAKKTLSLILLILVSLLSLAPFYMVISMSTHNTSEIYRGDLLALGTHLGENMKTIIAGGFGRYYLNSFVTAILTVLISSLISVMAAYGLTVFSFRAKKKVYAFIVASMMIPGQISLLGYCIEMRNMHLMNTLWPLIFTFSASAYSVYFITEFMRSSLPMEVVESARIDGCGERRILFQIALPLVKPAVITQIMLYFLWSWNNFLLPSTVLTDSSKFTVPLGIQTLATAYTQDLGARGAALALSVIPLIVLFGAGSKYFVQGLSAGAVKG